MSILGQKIRNLRNTNKLTLKQLEAQSGIDAAILSKIERGLRVATIAQLKTLSEILKTDENELQNLLKAEKIVYQAGQDDNATDVLLLAEQQILYGKTSNFVFSNHLITIKSVFRNFPSIKKAWVFGSVARNEKVNNDIDFAIKTDQSFSYFDLAQVRMELEEKLKIKVDIGFLDSIKREILKSVKNDIKLVYDKKFN
jgi:predicted nucleotidyltransferase